MSEKLSIEQLRQHDCFRRLTPQQRHAVEVFLETGSPLKSVQEAYHCNPRSARTMSYTVFHSSAAVVACLLIANGANPERVKSEMERKQFDYDLERAVKNPATTPSQVRALRLLAQTRGYIMPPAKTPEHAFKVGDRVTERDDAGVVHIGVVKAVDADGNAIEIEEVFS